LSAVITGIPRSLALWISSFWTRGGFPGWDFNAQISSGDHKGICSPRISSTISTALLRSILATIYTDFPLSAANFGLY